MSCGISAELLGAYFDSELDAGRSAEIAAHAGSCDACRSRLEEMERMRSGLSRLRLAAPEELRRRIAEAGRDRTPAGGATRALRWLALAASLAGAFWLGRALSTTSRPSPALADELVAAHLRSLQADHLFDVPSSDQHTVKPWFDGKVDFAPPVADFSGQGFPLAGGRLDYVGGRPVAAVVYRRAKHVVNVFFWPADGRADSPPVRSSVRGYNLVGWTHAGLAGRAVSDLNADELQALAELIRQGS